MWIPLNGGERDARSNPIPLQVPQGNGADLSAPSATAETEAAPTRVTGPLAKTSVIHAIRGRVRLRVPALKTSPNLAQPLERLLRDQPGVADVSVNDWCYSVTVTCDPSVWTSDKLCKWLQRLKATDIASYESANAAMDQAPATTDEAGDELWYSSAGIGVALLIEPLAAPLVPLLLLASALPMLKRARRSLTEDGKLNVDVLDASATSLLVVQANFPMAIFMVWLINIADWIRDLTMMRSKKAIEEILGYQNIEAWVVRDGQKVRVSVAEVQLGETVVVYPGERIAVDGTVLSGKALVDQASLTGESVPVEKEEGTPVYAATVVREGKALHLRGTDRKRH